MYAKVLTHFDDKDEFKAWLKDEFLLIGEKAPCKFDDPTDKHTLVPLLYPARAVELNTKLNSLPNTSVPVITLEQAVEQFNPRALEKLHIVILPCAEGLHAIYGPAIYPLRAKLNTALGIKVEWEPNFEGKGFGVNLIGDADVDAVEDFFTTRGYTVESYDEIA